MDSLQNHVEQLFRKYEGSRQIRELKLEVLGNLEARVADLTDNGVEYGEAVRQAKENLTSIDHLIDSNRTIYVNRFKLEFVQISLLYTLIAWIVTMPLQIKGIGILLNGALLVISVMIGIWYVVLHAKKQAKYMKRTAIVDMKAAFTWRKLAWVLWTIFICMSILYNTALHYGSNLWFARPVSITGPYQFAMVAITYAIPFVSILVPLLFHIAPKLMMKYEVGEEDEHEE